jgi:putative phosphoesterase
MPPTQTIAVISDTHLPRGRRELPAVCLAHLGAADLIVHAGDFSSISVLEYLQTLGPPVAAVHGNVDDRALVQLLPTRLEVDVGDARIGVIHDAGRAAGRLERVQRAFPDCAAVIFGHSHIPLHQRSGGFQIFNPGSPTDRRRQPHHTMGLARVAGGRISFNVVSLTP